MKCPQVIYRIVSKQVMSTSVFLLLTISLFSQKIAIENKKFNIAYPGIGNFFTIMVENVPCNELIITTDNGMIKGMDCEYEFIPNSIGIAKIYIKRKVKSNIVTLGERVYRIMRFPATAYIGRYKSDKIKATELKAQEGIVILIEKLDICGRIPVQRFTMKIVRNNTVICTLTNEGGKFNDAIRNELAKIKSGDKVYFEDIYAKMPGMKVAEKLNIIDLTVE
ncbi:MAG: GldM family protein [Saprospiraceae bacterium]